MEERFFDVYEVPKAAHPAPPTDVAPTPVAPEKGSDVEAPSAELPLTPFHGVAQPPQRVW